MLDSPTPIFVLGMNRSGTKWLSNLLANHPEIASVQAEFADGILETNILYPGPRKFDFSRDDDYAAFLALWNMSDFVQTTGIDVTRFARLRPQPRTPVQLFATLMNQYAKQQHKPYWVQKTGPEGSDAIVEQLPHARFIVILREVVDTVTSAYHLGQIEGQNDGILSTTFGYVLGEKSLLRLAKKTNAYVTTYAALRKDPRAELKRVCEHLQLSFSDVLLQLAYQPNSTFRNKSHRISLAWHQQFLVRSLAFALRCFPESVLRTYALHRPYARATVPFVPGTFHSLIKEILQEPSAGDPIESPDTANSSF